MESRTETIKRIFHATATSPDADYFTWAGLYLEKYPDFVFVHEEHAYCLGTPETTEEIIRLQPHLEKFRECFGDYPAHFHINVDPEFQGQGLGAKVLHRFEAELKRHGIKGVHLITGLRARNRGFYEKMDYVPVSAKEEIILLGKKL